MQRLARALFRLGPIAVAGLFLAKPVAAGEPGDPVAGRWTQFGNGPGHTGFYPVTIGDVPIVARWTTSFDGPINQVAVSDGRVFVTATGYTAGGDGGARFAAGLDGATGKQLWHKPGPFHGSPILTNGEVLFQTITEELHALNAADGSVQWIRGLGGYGAYGRPPTVFGDRIWTDSDYGVYARRISDGSQRFFARLNWVYGCRHSYYAGALYVSEGGIFRALDAETGVRLWTLTLPFHGGLGQEDNVPAIMSGKASVITIGDGSTGLTTVDVKAKSVLWSVPGNFYRRPATDGTTVYAIQGTGINAYAADTGELRGRYELGSAFPIYEFVPRESQPLVTNDLVMVGTNLATFVFDKATFTLRAKLPVGGYLTFTAGVLYIADLEGNLVTYRFEGAPAEPAPAPWPSATPPSGPWPAGTVQLVSVNRQGTATANNASHAAVLNSANGRYLFFTSQASDLTALSDNNGFHDLFVRDLQTGSTEMVSVNLAGTAPGNRGVGSTPGGYSTNASVSVSSDGRFVAFQSYSFDLVDSIPDTRADVFVRDLLQQKTIAASVDLSGKLVGGSQPTISADGRWVMFTSNAANLVPNAPPPGTVGVYVRDLQTNQTTLASVDEMGRAFESANGKAFTRDGRFVVFQALKELWLRDLQSQTSRLVTVRIPGKPFTGDVGETRVSEDGRFVVFESSREDLVAFDPNASATDIYVRDTLANTTERINSDENTAAILGDISSDGMIIGFLAHQYSFVYINDRRAGTTHQLVAGSALEGDLGSVGVLHMDPTGRFVAFQSFDNASFGVNLTQFDPYHPRLNVFVTDRQLGTTRLVSHDGTGTGSGNEGSVLVGLSDDGQTVAFNSTATNLGGVPDTNNSTSILVPDAFACRFESSGLLQNISTRGTVGTGDNALIGGFVLTGNAPRKIVIRATGPSLAAVGVKGVLPNPTLELYNKGGVLLAHNDDWKENQADVEMTGIPPADGLEAALVQTLDPGAYTAIVRGKGGSTGVGLVELYDLEQNPDSRLGNISTRGVVETGDKVLIAGFIAGGGGGGAANVLVRALGPTLNGFGVAGALQDPMLELRDPNGTFVASNDNWKATQRAEIEATTIPPINDAESATLNQLAPGPYTAIVRGSNNSTGVALVEVYHLP